MFFRSFHFFIYFFLVSFLLLFSFNIFYTSPISQLESARQLVSSSLPPPPSPLRFFPLLLHPSYRPDVSLFHLFCHLYNKYRHVVASSPLPYDVYFGVLAASFSSSHSCCGCGCRPWNDERSQERIGVHNPSPPLTPTSPFTDQYQAGIEGAESDRTQYRSRTGLSISALSSAHWQSPWQSPYSQRFHVPRLVPWRESARESLHRESR